MDCVPLQPLSNAECTDDVKNAGVPCCWCFSCTCEHVGKCKVVLVVLTMLFAIFDLGTDWMAFVAFAKDDFRSSPVGDTNDGLRIVWLSIIIPSTVIAVSDFGLKIYLICEDRKRGKYRTLSDTPTKNGGATEDGKTHGHDTNPNTELVLFLTTLLTFGKVLIEDGGNIGVSWYALIYSCTVKTESIDGLQVRYWLLMASFFFSCLSSITTLISLCQTYNACCRCFTSQGDHKGSCLNVSFCRISGFLAGLVAAGLLLMTAGIISTSLGRPSFLLEGSEVSIYIQSSSQSSSSFNQEPEFVANLSNVYKSGEKGLQAYVQRPSTDGCYVFTLKFDKDKRLVQYNYAIFYRSSACPLSCEQSIDTPAFKSDYRCNEDQTSLVLDFPSTMKISSVRYLPSWAAPAKPNLETKNRGSYTPIVVCHHLHV